jgi:hypothetical protein
MLSLCSLFLLLHHGPAARHDKFVPCAAAAAADAAAPLLLVAMALVQPLAAFAIVCLRVWLQPVVPPLLLPALLPSLVVSCVIACARSKSATAAAVTAVAVWFGWASMQQHFALSASFVADAGGHQRVVMLAAAAESLTRLLALHPFVCSSVYRPQPPSSAPAAPSRTILVAIQCGCSRCRAAALFQQFRHRHMRLGFLCLFSRFACNCLAERASSVALLPRKRGCCTYRRYAAKTATTASHWP